MKWISPLLMLLLLQLLMPGAAAQAQRYVDRGNGTVIDTKTNLVWLKDAKCLGDGSWRQARTRVSELREGKCGLTDGSVEGHWRLPGVEEILSLSFSDPKVSNSSGTAKWSEGDAFSGLRLIAFYWILKELVAKPDSAWSVDLDGFVMPATKSGHGLLIWAVRDLRDGEGKESVKKPPWVD